MDRKETKHHHLPLDIQITDVEAGAMCCSMIFKYYGLFLKRDEVNEIAGTSTDGTTLKRLADGFSRNGFDVSFHETNHVREVLLPAIARLDNGDYIVVYKFRKGTVYANHPRSGRIKYKPEELIERLDGPFLEVYPNEHFRKRGRPKRLRQFISETIGVNTQYIVYAIILGLMLLIPAIFLPASYKVFLDDVLGLGQEHMFVPLMFFLVLMMAFAGVVTYFQWHLMTRIEVSLAVLNSANFFRRLLRLPLPFFLKRYPGELSHRLPLVSQVALIFTVDLPKTVVNVLSIVLFAVVMLSYNVLLTVVGVLFSLINLIALKYISARREALNKTIIQSQGKVYSESMVGLRNIESIKASASENGFFAHWAGYQTHFINENQKLGYINRFLIVLPDFLKVLNNIILISMGAVLVIYDSLTIGVLVAFQALMDTFTKPVGALMENGSKFQDALSALTTLNDALDVDEDETFTKKVNFEKLKVGPANAKLKGKLEIKGLTFGYDRYAKPLINGFDLTARPGECIALVGSSGSGKSTIAKLIVGIHKPWEGEILFDGKPASEIPSVVLANSLAMVDQDVVLFSGTVRDNITMWNDQLPEEAIYKALEDACIAEVIAERPGGLDSKILEGGKNFSGGQRQRLEIARALAVNPSLLILDEATSALDSETEKAVMNNLKKRGCTMLIIAHRLSTIRDCDRILVFENGKVLQTGSHSELIKQKDQPYYQLIKTG